MGDGTVRPGGSELDHLLGSVFGDRAMVQSRRSIKGQPEDDGLGDVSLLGHYPGVMYAEGRQTQRGGMRGTDAYAFLDKLDPQICPPWLKDPGCADALSRLLEQTLRNFQQTARLPSHVSPPFQAKPIAAKDCVIIPAVGTAANPFTDVICFTVSSTRFRGEVQAVGQLAESAAAWLDLEWRITVDGQPYHPYISMIGQSWDWFKTPLCAPIHLISEQVICLQARAIVNGPYEVCGRLCGWEYPVRTEVGDVIASTLVD